MYNIEYATFEEFGDLVRNSFECGEANKDYYNNFCFNKFTFDGEPLVISGCVLIDDPNTEEKEVYMCFAISKKIVKHKRAILVVGREYLDFIGETAPICVIVEHNNGVFEKFAKHFGFKCTNFVEKDEESGIIYDVYIRR